MPLELWDVFMAYCNAKNDFTIYAPQVKGFEVKGKEDHVIRVLRNLYGMQKAGHRWFMELLGDLIESGWRQSRCLGPSGVHLGSSRRQSTGDYAHTR